MYTNKGQTLGFHPGNRDSVLEERHKKMQTTYVVTPSCQGCCQLSNTRHTGINYAHRIHRNQNTSPPS
jgi:hypothetical protein